ncbi:MAG: hypothetical protein AB1403_01805 [Candidatus Riflebacteria bacterium]
MWIAVQLSVCAIFLVIAAFWIGRFFGKRHYLKLHEEMRALELSFNQLIDEMELASSHNMKVIEKQSEDLSELLTIADKKILRVNDFLKELDETTAGLRKKVNMGIGADAPDLQSERRLKNEIKQTIETMQNQIRLIAERLQEVEDRPMPELGKPEIDYKAIRNVIEEEVTRQVNRQLNFLEQQLEPQAKPEKSERVIPIRPARENPLSSARFIVKAGEKEEPVIQYSEKITELKPANIETTARMPAKKTDFDTTIESSLPEPIPGTPVYDVLQMAHKGVTVPQIARSLNMGKGEIELILKIYGARVNMRNVV